MKKAYYRLLVFLIAPVFMVACSPTDQSTAEVETVGESANIEEEVVAEPNKLFLNEIYGFYFQVPDSWVDYKTVYEPENSKSLGEKLIEGENLAFGAKKIIRFIVNNETVIEFYVVSNENWDEISSNPDGPIPFKVGSGSYNTFLYSINQGVQSTEAKKAMKDFQDTINDSFGVM